MKDVYEYMKMSGCLPFVMFRIRKKAGMRKAHIWHEGNVARYLVPGNLQPQRIPGFLVRASVKRKIPGISTTDTCILLKAIYP